MVMENKEIVYFKDMSCRIPMKVNPKGHQSLFVLTLCYHYGENTRMDEVAYDNFKLANARLELELCSRENYRGEVTLGHAELDLVTFYDGKVVGSEFLFARSPRENPYSWMR